MYRFALSIKFQCPCYTQLLETSMDTARIPSNRRPEWIEREYEVLDNTQRKSRFVYYQSTLLPKNGSSSIYILEVFQMYFLMFLAIPHYVLVMVVLHRSTGWPGHQPLQHKASSSQARQSTGSAFPQPTQQPAQNKSSNESSDYIQWDDARLVNVLENLLIRL